MPFLQLTLCIGAADPEPFEEALLAAGATSITLQDAADDPVLEPAPGTTPLWPRVRVAALFDASVDATGVLASLRGELSVPLADAKFEILEDRVWEREWLKDFRPMRFGRRLWIAPGGQSIPATEQSSESRVIELDPGLAFGTGTHATTALCLEWLDGAALAGKTIVDYGCGCGVLAIAALKLGASQAWAVDIDPQALLATQNNAERNGVAERLHVGPPAQLPGTADIVLANILAQPLLELAATFAALLVSHGRLVLSGVLQNQAAAVASRYAAWFDIASEAVRDDWVRLDGVRRHTE
ncbi:MAG: 50S ribosomal protein L11 methyltransferase [Steroidobacteraceae bacterium]